MATIALALLPLGLGACSGGDSSPAQPDPSADVAVLAEDNHFDQQAYQASAGEVSFSYVERGRVAHTLLIEDVDGFKLRVSTSKDTDGGTAQLAPGTYTLYCDVPGHRPSMEATLTVT